MTKSTRKNVGDRISELVDDILVPIISRLTLKEATATSVLSTRWRPLHTRISRLNFPTYPSDVYIFGELSAKKEKKFTRDEYVKMINHTLDSYDGGRLLKEFKLRTMKWFRGLDINRLLEFALARNAEIIDILILISSTNCGLQLEKLIIKSPQTLPGLKCLRELSLFGVEADDVDVKVLLSNTPNLESLSLGYSDMLRNVSIVGHPKLQHICISCSKVEFIEIENVINLVSLRFNILPCACVVHVNNVPKLIEFNAGDLDSYELLFNFPSSIRSQLLLARLKLERLDSFQVGSLPELINVKHLEVQCAFPSQLHPVDRLIRLIEACRSLEKFEMTIKYSTNIGQNFVPRVPFLENRDVKECSPHLKEMKLSGYLDVLIESEVVAFIVKYAASSLQELMVAETCETSKANVRNRLLQITPSTVNLVII